MSHRYIINEVPKKIPTNRLPDGAVAGNGDVGVIWAGTSDHVRLYVSKVDFWRALPTIQGNVGAGKTQSGGGPAPIGTIELCLPQLPYAPYHVEQRIDEGILVGKFEENGCDATVTVAVCATENTILIEVDRSQMLSVSAELEVKEGNEAVCEKGELGNLSYVTRTFDAPDLYFPTAAMMTMTEVSRVRENGRERVRWSVHVVTSHDSAAFKNNAICAAQGMSDERFVALRHQHDAWWKKFWSVSGITLPDKALERHWYMDMYVMACCSRNMKFPAGLWGNLLTQDGPPWWGDYHLNYNYQSPYAALCVAGHPELTDNYDRPLVDFAPRARRYAREFLGCRGTYYPVSLGPIGMETDMRKGVKEHGHLFLGQKSHGAYSTFVMIERWYTTYDEDYARDHLLPFLLDQADFWEDYLVQDENGKYHSLNDSLFEVDYWLGADYMPKDHSQQDPISSIGFVRLFMNCLADVCTELGLYPERIAKWKDIAQNFGPTELKDSCEDYVVSYGWRDCDKPREYTLVPLERDGTKILAPTAHSNILNPYLLEYIYPANQVTSQSDPELLAAAKHVVELLDCWNDERMPFTVFASAVRVGMDPETILAQMKRIMDKRELPNGLMEFIGGGMEDSANLPIALQEMLLQSYEQVLRLFPCWDRRQPASFRGLRAYGAFVVDGATENGEITATIRSEKGRPLTVEAPAEGYVLCGEGVCVPLKDKYTTIDTVVGGVYTIKKA